jgi:hypothetical protein
VVSTSVALGHVCEFDVVNAAAFKSLFPGLLLACAARVLFIVDAVFNILVANRRIVAILAGQVTLYHRHVRDVFRNGYLYFG